MMIFTEKHIEQIINGQKTQTRRASGRYILGRTYAIQPCRTCKAIPDGRILIIGKKLEPRLFTDHSISIKDALAEGGYTQQQFYELYREMYPGWMERYTYNFRFILS